MAKVEIYLDTGEVITTNGPESVADEAKLSWKSNNSNASYVDDTMNTAAGFDKSVSFRSTDVSAFVITP